MKLTRINEDETDPALFSRWGGDDFEALTAPPGYEKTNLTMWSAKALRLALNKLYALRHESALLVLGDPGVGKSQMVRAFAEEVAKREKREFIDIHNYDIEELVPMTEPKAGTQANIEDINQIKNANENIDKSYMFLDLRAGNLNPELTTGIPNTAFGQKYGFLKFLPPDWARLVTRKNFHGMIFLDEVNRSNTHILNSLLQLVLDRKIGGGVLSPNVTICAAGNLAQNSVGVETLDPAFRSRFSLGVLVVSKEEWVEWARSNNVSQYIINYILATKAEQTFYQSPDDVGEENIPLNPRQLAAASRDLKWVVDVYAKTSSKEDLPEGFIGKMYQDIARIMSGRLPREWVNNFIKWVIATNAFKWGELVELSKKGELGMIDKGDKKSLTEDKKWHLVSYVCQETMARFEKARKRGDLNEQNEILIELYTDLYHIFTGLGYDPLMAILTNMVNNIRYFPPKGVETAQATKNWEAVMGPIVRKAKADNPEVYTRLQKVFSEIKKLKEERI